MRSHLAVGEKPLDWVGSAKQDFLRFRRQSNARSEGPGVFEVVDDFDGDTYRAVYTVRFRRVVYVLHAFQKKSPRG